MLQRDQWKWGSGCCRSKKRLTKWRLPSCPEFQEPGWLSSVDLTALSWPVPCHVLPNKTWRECDQQVIAPHGYKISLYLVLPPPWFSAGNQMIKCTDLGDFVKLSTSDFKFCGLWRKSANLGALQPSWGRLQKSMYRTPWGFSAAQSVFIVGGSTLEPQSWETEQPSGEPSPTYFME